jgi:hypothetical protein
MPLITSTVTAAPIISRDTVSADLGFAFTAVTPTPGTGIIGHAISTTLVETKAIFLCFNGGNTASIYPLYLRLTMTVLPVGNTMQQFTTALDQGNRFSSGGTALTVNNSNINSGTLSQAQITVGAVVTTAASTQRRITSHRAFRPTVIGVVGDVYQFSWGSGELVDPSALPTDGTNRAHVMYVMSPLVVAPQTSMLIHAWGATFSTGATYEYEFGYVEK